MKKIYYRALLKQKKEKAVKSIKAFFKEVANLTIMETILFGFLVILIIGVVLFGSGLILVLGDAM